MINLNELNDLLPPEPKRNILIFSGLPSTNDKAKELALEDAPGGTVVIAGYQTAGRGRLGRSFYSPEDDGLYMSALYRPDVSVADLLTLTAFVSVAVCGVLENLTGHRPRSKWPNDIVANDGKKLCGILTELFLYPSGKTRSVVIGIGVNVSQTAFPPQLENIASSLRLAYGVVPPLSTICAAIIESLDGAVSACGDETRSEWLRVYRNDCITVGKRVAIMRRDNTLIGKATGIDSNAALIVKFDDGTSEAVSSGEVVILRQPGK